MTGGTPKVPISTILVVTFDCENQRVRPPSGLQWISEYLLAVQVNILTLHSKRYKHNASLNPRHSSR